MGHTCPAETDTQICSVKTGNYSEKQSSVLESALTSKEIIIMQNSDC